MLIRMLGTIFLPKRTRKIQKHTRQKVEYSGTAMSLKSAQARADSARIPIAERSTPMPARRRKHHDANKNNDELGCHSQLSMKEQYSKYVPMFQAYHLNFPQIFFCI